MHLHCNVCVKCVMCSVGKGEGLPLAPDPFRGYPFS